jgi:PucR family transcriptional regulator, purine catabolism regulatory protein
MIAPNNTPSISLPELLRLTFTKPVEWLSEEPNQDIQVRWVVSSPTEGQESDLLLMPAADISLDTIALAARNEISAILLVGIPPKSKRIPQSPLAILSINTDLDIRSIQQKIIFKLTNQNSAIMERSIQVHAQLMKMAAEDVSQDGLAKAMSDITGRGILIQDKRLNVTSQSSAPDLHTAWRDIIDQLCKRESLPETLRDRSQAGKQSMILHQVISGGITRLIAPIIVGNIARGYLSLIGVEGTLDALDRIVANEGALVCAVDMSRRKAVRETEKRLQSDLLTALFHGILSPRDAAIWIEAMGLDQTKSHVALQFTWDSPQHPSRRRLETIINGEIVRLGLKVITNPADDKIICFCEVDPSEKRPLAALELGSNILNLARIEYPQDQPRCGIGSLAVDLSSWNISFKEAGYALEMASRLQENKPLFYPDLSIYRLLMLLEHHPELHTYMEDVLGVLIEQDEKNRLMDTLESYFEHQGNLSQTAEALFIHRNTLSYRLDKIAEITELDLNNADIGLSVQLALKIHRMNMGIK